MEGSGLTLEKTLTLADTLESAEREARVRDELSVHGQLLLRGDRLVVPAALRERVLTNAHAGHQGVVRTKQRLRERFWWPRLDRQVRDLLKSCEVCSQHDGHVRRERPPLQPIPLPDGPWQRLMVDVIGPMRGPSSERYGIVLVDMYSRWPEVALCQDATADSICQFLETVFAREEVRTGRTARPSDWSEVRTGSAARPADWAEVRTGRTARSSDWTELRTGRTARPSDWSEVRTGRTARPSDWSEVRTGSDARPAPRRGCPARCSLHGPVGLRLSELYW
ncbi:uncharacterized protein FJT64_010969 [Amphibalanus amphitrite]|uniref:RNA-directed DNA polymerase n=1 Tax=Amphibalanus amphitrite TaxID=1232801 RepID=A0A6A4VCJ8_AMPAM|nr:uncharacterized protein FJT64_010969 [Amphibalanus amphitrite]